MTHTPRPCDGRPASAPCPARSDEECVCLQESRARIRETKNMLIATAVLVALALVVAIRELFK